MNTKLIIVDGHCSVGKSTVSKSVFKQIAQSQDAYWLHEECEAHPIRQDEFSFGALDSVAGMELNRIGMLKKWKTFAESILEGGKVCVTEGCLLHAYDRYFIHSLWGDEEIVAYYDQVLEVIQGLNPVIVLLYRPDLRASLDQAFAARGKWWRDLILRRDDLHVYFKDHQYVDENSMYDAVAFEQQKIFEIFDRLKCSKIKIDTTQEQWDQVDREIMRFINLPYRKLDPHPTDLQRYAGRYQWQSGSETVEWVIHYDENRQSLYTSQFWPYMPMRCLAEDVFELISFPVELHFKLGKEGLQFSVHGNYDWEFNDQIFRRV